MNGCRLLWRRSMLALALISSAAAGRAAEETSWTWCGWGGGGFFWSAAFDPSNASTVYLGGDVAGIYKSEDQGRHWRFINRGLHDYGVYSLAVARDQPSTLYAMTTDGMARSTDAGATWTPLQATRNKGGLGLSINRPGSVRAVAIDPADSRTVYAGSGSGLLCRSRDGGETWAPLDYRAALPKPPAAPAIPAASGTGFLWMAYSSAADDWKSHGRVEKFLSQKGEDWSRFSRLTAAMLFPSNAPSLQAQLVVQSGAGWLWQQGESMTGRPGEWTELALDLTTLKEMESVHIAYIVVRSGGKAVAADIGLDAVTLHPADASQPPVVLGGWEKAGNEEGWRAGSHSKDAPQIAAIRTSAEPPPKTRQPIGSIAVAASDPRLVFVASQSLGLFRSTDGGDSWTLAKAPARASCVAVADRDSRRVYGAFGKDGIWKSIDGGLNWSQVLTNACSMREVAIDPRNPDVVHVIGGVNWGGTYFRSNDGGATWQSTRRFTRDLSANPTVPDETGGGEIKHGMGNMSTLSNLALSPSDPDVLFVAGNWHNILSTDGGATWRESVRGADITCAHDIRFCGTNTYVAAMDEGLLVSSDNGASWRQIAPRTYTPGLSGHQWRVSAVNRGGQDHVVSTVSAWRTEREHPNQVLVSMDGGRSFRQTRKGLPDYLPKVNCMWGEGYARALAADPADPDVLYLGIDGDPEPDKGRAGGGLFKSTDGGRTWTQLPNQPGSRRMFYGLAIDPTDSRRLFWGACGDRGGVYRSPDAGATWEKTNVGESWIFNVEAAASGTLYAGGNNLWRSRDHGQTWQPISKFSGFTVVGIATDPANDDRVWVSLVTWGSNDKGGIHRTTDGGRTWQEITGDIGYRKPLILRYNPATHELWAGGVGLFRTRQ